MRSKIYLSFAAIPALLLVWVLAGYCQATQYQRFIVGLHYDSNVSGGILPPHQMVKLSIDNRMDAVIFCDHLRKEVEYGINPLRKIVRKKVSFPSVSTYGTSNYLQMMDELDQKNPSITIIPGVEVGPSYYWSGNPIDKSLKLHNWHQHMLVFGLDKGSDYDEIPGTSAGQGSEEWIEDYNRDIGAAAVIFIGIILMLMRVKRKVKYLGQSMRVKRRPYKYWGLLLIVAGVLLLANDYPFKKTKFSPYESGHCIEASQEVINHVISRGGLIYYAHPEAEYAGQIDWINTITHPYANLLLKTKDYTGFAIFAEGWKVSGVPGGIWDRTLYQYINGEREKPVWVVAEVDFEGTLPANFIREAATYVWAADKSRESVLEALAKGRCYAAQIWGPNMIWLDRWSLDNGAGEEKISGETLSAGESVNIHFSFTVADDADNFEVFIIRNGRQVANIPFDDSIDLHLKDSFPVGNTFYRLWVLYKGLPALATNPIFVQSSTG